MSARFATNLIAVLGGGWLLASALAFHAPTVTWIAVEVGVIVLGAVVIAFLARGRDMLVRDEMTRAIDICLAVTAVWTLVASRVVTAQGPVKWLTFGEAAVICALGVLGLITHEIVMQRNLSRATRADTNDRVASGTTVAGTSYDGGEPAPLQRRSTGRRRSPRRSQTREGSS